MKVSSFNFISNLQKIPRAKLWASENMGSTQVLTGISRIKRLISYTTNILATQSFWVTSAKDQFIPWIILTHFPRSNIILLWVRKLKQNYIKWPPSVQHKRTTHFQPPKSFFGLFCFFGDALLVLKWRVCWTEECVELGGGILCWTKEFWVPIGRCPYVELRGLCATEGYSFEIEDFENSSLRSLPKWTILKVIDF